MATSNTTVKDSAGAAGVTADGSPDEALGIDDVAQILGVSRWKVFDLIGRDPSDPAFLASYQNSDGPRAKRFVRRSVLAAYQKRREDLSAAEKRPGRGRRTKAGANPAV